jgi:hypothetical protein
MDMKGSEYDTVTYPYDVWHINMEENVKSMPVRKTEANIRHNVYKIA